jgi:uncharacterized protein YdgA (DUF945 family)
MTKNEKSNYSKLKQNKMTENWDKFEPFKGVQKQGFSFRPSRYETWIGGKMVDSGNVSANVSAKVVNQNSSEKMSVTFNEMNLEDEISSELFFDEFVTANDRLQLITIPNETNSENMGIMMFKMTIGATCQQKHFSSIEPYCCNLFLINGVISKITFSFSSPEKLIELYQ